MQKLKNLLRKYKHAVRNDYLAEFEAKVEAHLAEAKTLDEYRAGANLLVELANKFPGFKERQMNRFRKRLVRAYPDHVPELTARMVDMFNAQDMAHTYVKGAKRYNKLTSCSSFRASLTMRSRRKVLLGAKTCPEWQVDHKLRAYRFADKLGVRRPWQNDAVAFSDLKEVPGSVIKPVAGAGARGVYFVLDDGRGFDAHRGELLSGWQEVLERAQKGIDDGKITAKQWITEELITDSQSPGGMARDLKFLCFYGKAVLVREFTRYPERADNWWDADGNPAKVGGALQGKRLGGEAPPRKYYELAERISREIPAPFMRIDFVTSDNGLVLNEFTPRPGTYDRFNRLWDQRLGDAFLMAEARLSQDLLAGKNFEAYKAFVNSVAGDS